MYFLPLTMLPSLLSRITLRICYFLLSKVAERLLLENDLFGHWFKRGKPQWLNSFVVAVHFIQDFVCKAFNSLLKIITV